MVCLASVLLLTPQGVAAQDAGVQSGTAQVASDRAGLHFDLLSHDFGTVDEGVVLDYSFEFRNTSNTPLEIVNVEATCGCTVLDSWDRVVEPGQTGRIPVRLNTRTFNGPVRKAINVTTSDPTMPRVMLTLAATVMKQVWVEPQYLNFGPVRPGSQPVATATIHSRGLVPLQLEVVESSVQAPFSARLETVTENREYRLVVTLDSTSRTGHVATPIEIRTGLEADPLLRLSALGQVLNAMEVFPRQMLLVQAARRPSRWTFTVRNNMPEALEYVETRTDAEFLTFEHQELEAGRLFEVYAIIDPEFGHDPNAPNKTIEIHLRVRDTDEVRTIQVPVIQSVDALRAMRQ